MFLLTDFSSFVLSLQAECSSSLFPHLLSWSDTCACFFKSHLCFILSKWALPWSVLRMSVSITQSFLLQEEKWDFFFLEVQRQHLENVAHQGILNKKLHRHCSTIATFRMKKKWLWSFSGQLIYQYLWLKTYLLNSIENLAASFWSNKQEPFLCCESNCFRLRGEIFVQGTWWEKDNRINQKTNASNQCYSKKKKPSSCTHLCFICSMPSLVSKVLFFFTITESGKAVWQYAHFKHNEGKRTDLSILLRWDEIT